MKGTTQQTNAQPTKAKGEANFSKSEKQKDVRTDNINAAKGTKLSLPPCKLK